MLELFFEEAQSMGTLDKILAECGLTPNSIAPPVFIAAETEEVCMPCSL